MRTDNPKVQFIWIECIWMFGNFIVFSAIYSSHVGQESNPNGGLVVEKVVFLVFCVHR